MNAGRIKKRKFVIVLEANILRITSFLLDNTEQFALSAHLNKINTFNLINSIYTILLQSCKSMIRE